MKILNAGLTEYNEALKNLNDKLVAIGKYIEVRAIGGYAMLYNGLRSGGYTVDVDTVTEDYSDDIKRLVVEVSEEEGIEDDWVNNDAYSLEEVMGIFDELEWIRDKSYSNIKLFIATEESMLKLKIRAVHFGGLVPRVTDQLDFLDLLGALDIHSIDELSKSSVTKDMKEKYPRSYEFLLKQGNW